ncbi:MAG: hypothetical protein MJ252_24985 [archaeon]|nr:hypothetical protein [archaeon]
MESSPSTQNILTEEIISKLLKIDEELPTIPNKIFNYGTSGFRYPANIMDKIVFRTAIMTCFYSMQNDGLPTGMMLSASHNVYTDNGIKLAGIKGEMVSEDSEKFFVEIANTKNLRETMIEITKKIQLKTNKFYILIGHDTRESNENFVKIITKCLECFSDCKYKCYGIVTTPCLHFLTYFSQIMYKKNKIQFDFPPLENYWKFLKLSYEDYMNFYCKYIGKEDTRKEKEFYIDCANGTAAFCKDNIKEIMSSNKSLKISFINTDYKNFKILNDGCGAEFVHKSKAFPAQYNKEVKENLAFDGDVDRIIYFISVNDQFRMIDGDRLIVLNAMILNHFTSLLSPELREKFFKEIKIGVVTTAYANGALISYIKNNFPNLDLVLGKTGVKNVHAKANSFDMAVYFEANGHGNFHVDENFEKKINKLQAEITNSKDSQILELLLKYVTMFNVTIGDSLSIYLATDAALFTLNKTLEDIANIFQEIPNELIKVKVKDKSIFICNEDESRLIEPVEVQKFIDETVKGIEQGRCFMRPSGTEDVVRLYAEAAKKEDCHMIMEKVKELLSKY